MQQLHNDVSAAIPWSNEPVPGPEQPWRRRIAAGALLIFILLLVSLPGSVADMIVGPGSISLVINLALFIPVSAAGVIAVWLMTTPLPQETGWLKYLRWMARIGAIVNVSATALNAVAQYAPGLLDAWQESFVATRLIVFLGGLLGATAAFWYFSRLASRLGDRGLKLTFGFLKWLCVVYLVFVVAFMLLTWPDFCERMIKRPGPGSGGLGVLFENPPCFLLACVAVSLVVWVWYARLFWLLYRLVRGTKPTTDEQAEVGSGK